jgi:integrase/recombinase XerD
MRHAKKLLPVEDWPTADREAWSNATQKGDRFEDGGPGSHWAERTIRTIKHDYRRWLGHLRETDPDALDLSPVDRITQCRIRAYIDHLQASISPAGTHNYIKHLADAARVMGPSLDWRWLREIAIRLEKLVTPKNKRPRMVSSHQLADLGRQLMSEAEQQKGLRPKERAILYRDGLMIALLAARPLRRRNLAGIRIGRNLIPCSDGYHLVFKAHETKTHTPLEFMVPDDLVGLLQTYLDVHRPNIVGSNTHDSLWASAKGCPLREEGIYDRIILHTKKAFGRSINPHLFRDCVATTIAIEDPAHVGIAADLLGHASLEFTQTHYIQAQTLEASRSYHDSIRQLRQKVSERKSKPDKGD